MQITNRKTLDIPATEYHQRPEIASGQIRTFVSKGPLTFYHRYIAKTLPDKDSPSKRRGRLLHSVAEGGAWEDYIKVIPSVLEDDKHLESVIEDFADSSSKVSQKIGTPINLRSPIHRAYRQRHELEAESLGLEICTADELEIIKRQMQAIMDNPAAAQFVTMEAAREVSGIAHDETTELDVRALGDVVALPVIADYKTTRHLLPRDFISDALSKGYHYQAAHYLQVFGAEVFVIISVTSTEPYEAMCWEVTPRRIEEARESNDKALQDIAACMATGGWHTDGWGRVVLLEKSHLME